MGILVVEMSRNVVKSSVVAGRAGAAGSIYVSIEAIIISGPGG